MTYHAADQSPICSNIETIFRFNHYLFPGHEKPSLLCYNAVMPMMIDFHTHIFPPRIKENRDWFTARDPLFRLLYSDPKARIITADELISNMDEHHVEVSVVLNIDWITPDLCHETNDYILESMARFPNRLAGFCMVRLDSPDASLKELERCLKNGIKGVGEVRPSPEMLSEAGRIQPLIQEIIDRGLILLTHCSEPVGHLYAGKGDITPEILYPFIKRYPDLKLVCGHWGGGLPFYALMPEVKKAFGNVYFDSAASPYLYSPAIYDQVAKLVGPDKILFGTDYPLISPARSLKEIESAGIPEDVKAKLLCENARRLLGL